MKLSIERTDRLVEFQGRTVRVWHGTSDRGEPCEVFVASLIGPSEESDFAGELVEAGVPHVPLCQRRAAQRLSKEVKH